jgi:hypothetical protein
MWGTRTGARIARLGLASERSERSGMGALGAADSAGEAWRAAAQDRHAFGDERDPLSPENRLPMAIFAARGLSAAFDGLQHLPRLPAGRSVGGDTGGAARGPARTIGAGGQPQRRRHRQPVAQVGRKGGCAKGEADAVGYDAGKKVKGRKVHALVDTEGLPLRVVVRRHPGPGWRSPGLRAHPPALQLARTRLGRWRLQRRRRRAATAARGDRQTP